MAIRELIQNDARTLLLVSPTDLQEFALSVVNEYSKLTTLEEKKYTPKEFAKRHNVSEATLWRWCKAGILKRTIYGGKVYYRDSDLKEG